MKFTGHGAMSELQCRYAAGSDVSSDQFATAGNDGMNYTLHMIVMYPINLWFITWFYGFSFHSNFLSIYLPSL